MTYSDSLERWHLLEQTRSGDTSLALWAYRGELRQWHWQVEIDQFSKINYERNFRTEKGARRHYALKLAELVLS